VAVQMARSCFECQHVIALCSRNNESFCYQQGATLVVAYDDRYTDDNDNNDKEPLALQPKLHQPSGALFDIGLDCVTSADPRDEKCNYPKLLQHQQQLQLKDDYVYRPLGRPTLDWIRAGMERTLPCNTNLIWNRNYDSYIHGWNMMANSLHHTLNVTTYTHLPNRALEKCLYCHFIKTCPWKSGCPNHS
jgi:hypothetical protein